MTRKTAIQLICSAVVYSHIKAAEDAAKYRRYEKATDAAMKMPATEAGPAIDKATTDYLTVTDSDTLLRIPEEYTVSLTGIKRLTFELLPGKRFTFTMEELAKALEG